ncbi:hypothetical protein EJV47_16335 [Hymenobacter gummosus]|uniref:Uncharacterized protein n=1 Tax=Hymenobacter gummosus TaxID=1776032 RepID=A0A431U0S4_9BACT|nr:hypothetical protein [Hymenobacter gummosus]RTQ48539.1 hypothetical protein EJV47_16335 [Hymenobacter gummosus]
MLRVFLLWLGICLAVLDGEAATLAAEAEATAPATTLTVAQKVPRPRYKRYGRRRRLRRARRKARLERKKAPRRKGVITVDPPVRN